MLSPSQFLLMSQQLDKLYTQLLRPLSGRYGISKVEIDVLLFLHNNPPYDTARDIAEMRHIAKSYVSKAVDLLMQKGYLVSLPDERDHRVLHLRLQPAASAALRDAVEAQQQFGKLLHRGISPADQARLDRICQQMEINVKEALSHVS